MTDSSTTSDIVHRLWALCHVLRDDGITYHQYVNELSYLLFLKMASETGAEANLPAGYRWADLAAQGLPAQLNFYRELLTHLGASDSLPVRTVFGRATTALRTPSNLARLVAEFDRFDWYSAHSEGLGDMYEGLLAKNAGEAKSGTGQYFTPRPLIEIMVACMQPQFGEAISDPALGTGGFLVAAHRHMSAFPRASSLHSDGPPSATFTGVELVPDVHRLALMNLMLHGIESNITLGDTLSPLGAGRPSADVILTNPPFGSRRTDKARRTDLPHPTGNKQLAFLQHVCGALKPGGRAAVVIPDNVLFEEGTGQRIRTDLMARCRLHTLLRLPPGIFYAQGVKTNVLFFTRGHTERDNTDALWVYDLRTNMPSFGKRAPLTRSHFDDFLRCYGPDPHARTRPEPTDSARFRRYSRAALAARDDNLNITWLPKRRAHEAAVERDPQVLIENLMNHLRGAIADVKALRALLPRADE